MMPYELIECIYDKNLFSMENYVFLMAWFSSIISSQRPSPIRLFVLMILFWVFCSGMLELAELLTLKMVGMLWTGGLWCVGFLRLQINQKGQFFWWDFLNSV